MATSGKLADLFIDISLRGGGKIELLALRDKILASDKALANNADMYGRQTSAKIKQMTEIAKRSAELAKIDQSTYGSLKYGDYAKAQSNADIEREIALRQKSIALTKSERAALAGPRGDVAANMEAKDTADSLLKNQEKAIALGKAELALHKGKQGAEVAQKTLQADRIKKQVEEVKQQQLMIAQYGKVGATIKQTTALLTMANALKFAGPIGAVVGAAAATAPAASPVHADMLAKSFQLLSAQIGTLLLPIVTDLSFGLQKLAGVVEILHGKIGPDGQKKAGLLDWIGFKLLGPFDPFFKDKKPLTPSPGPASFEPFDQTWKRLQQQAAGTGPLEQEILKVQLKNLEKLGIIATNTAPNNPPPPPPPIGNGN